MPRLTDGDVIINGVEYYFFRDKNAPSYRREARPVQPGDPGNEFSVRIENFAYGWGHSRYMERGTYDYATTAILHRRLSFLPGSVVTAAAPAHAPTGPVSFVEYWDGTEANRRLIAISPRYINEIAADGSLVEADLGAAYTTVRAMTRGVLFKNSGMSVPMVFIARQSATATDYMVVRTAAGTYSASAASKRADAVGAGKDSAGANVLWIVDPDAKGGELRQLVADADPQAGGSWATATYPIGETSTRANGVLQASKRMLVGRPDGVFSFDNVARSIPLLPMESTRDSTNCMNMKDWNGAAVVCSLGAMYLIDGLSWEPCGPVSSNQDARNLRSVREVAFATAADYVYCATWDGTNSYLYMGTVRTSTRTGSGTGPFIWHGPIATIATKRVTDLCPSAVTTAGKKLWIGYTDGFASIALNADWSPTPNATAGYIYLPEGLLDQAGPQVTKEIHSVEFITPASAPMDANNTWGADFDFGSGWTSIGVANSGSYHKETFGTEKTARRPLMRLVYASNGTAELECAVVRGLERPEHRYHRMFRLGVSDRQRKTSGARTWAHPETVEANLTALVDSGQQTVIVQGGTSFTGKVIKADPVTEIGGRLLSPTKVFDVEIIEI